MDFQTFATIGVVVGTAFGFISGAGTMLWALKREGFIEEF